MASLAQLSKKPNTSAKSPQLANLKNHVYTMVAAFSGVVLGVLGSLGFVGSYMHAAFAAENTTLSHKLVSMMPTDDVTSACVAPAGSTGTSGNSGKTVTAAAVAPSSSAPVGMGGGGGGTGGGGGFTPPVVDQSSNNSIGGTNNDTKNTIKTTNTAISIVKNDNNIGVSNVNVQGAKSGSASLKDDSNAGSATTGAASNDNDTSTSVSVSN